MDGIHREANNREGGEGLGRLKVILEVIGPPLSRKEVEHKRNTQRNNLGCGEQHGYEESYRGIKFEVNLLKKVRLEIAVNEDFVQKTIDAIIKGARTGKIGDGKIFVLDLAECIRIRTDEKGNAAIG